jgi:hypothetical protein
MGHAFLIAMQEPGSIKMCLPLKTPIAPALQRRPGIARPRRCPDDAIRPWRRARAQHDEGTRAGHAAIMRQRHGDRALLDAIEGGRAGTSNQAAIIFSRARQFP